MNTQKYGARLPALRVSNYVRKQLERLASERQINLAEMHRVALGYGLMALRHLNGDPDRGGGQAQAGEVSQWDKLENQVERILEALP